MIDLFLHLDKHLLEITQAYGRWSYPLLFLIVFCETGLVVTPFLPGDSLLFAAGALAGMGILDPIWLFVLLWIAAVAGDTLNYWIGAKVGPRAFQGNIRFLKKEYLERTRVFYEKYGGKTIVLARFMPIVRTFAPFVAGIGAMNYPQFVAYNVIGGFIWVSVFIGGGYWFGNLPYVKQNFTLVIMAIIVLSILPGVFEYISHRRAQKIRAL